MKCVRCGTDSDYNTRQASGRCRTCGTYFAFEPRRDRSVTDLAFKLAIAAVSDDERLAWNDDHLYYDVCRRVRRRRILHRVLRRPIVSLERSFFDGLLDRWIDTHGLPPGQLEGRAFPDGISDALEPRVNGYGFEQLVVCDHEATADVLLANGFHADAKCPVLAYSGYPAHVYAELIPALRERPPATVVVVHDGDWAGCGLARAIADDQRWFAGVELPRIVDAGLRPADARGFRGLWRAATSSSDAASSEVTAAEARWLRTYRLDLAAARPRVLMSLLARVLRGETAADGADGEDLWLGAWGDGDDDVG